jgi:hypothetical protein
MKRETKPTQQEQERIVERQARQSAITEFESVEAMLRHDRLRTLVPPTIEHRLRESIGPSPAPAAPWWRRLFGK